MSGLRFLVLSGMALALAGGLAGTAAAGETPPSCGAVNFRPVSGTPPDGTLDAGLYKSRFGKIVLRAEISGGQARNYYVELNGKRPEPLKGALPASVNKCLNAKHVKTPPPSAGESCTGQRFRVVLDRTAKQKYLMLFGLQGDTWQLCSASQM